MIQSFVVEKMHCDACVNRVTKLVGRIPDVVVKQVEIGSVSVDLADPGQADAIVSTLTGAGFPTRAVASRQP